jgi:hypothetical protein
MKPTSSFLKLSNRLTSLFVCVLLSNVYGQESVNASGGDASGSAGTMAYSIGQVVYTTNSSSSGTSAQGVQHAYEIFTVGIPEVSLNFSITAFPNPTTDHITLQINEGFNESLFYQLYDLQGKMLTREAILAEQTIIDMKALAKATYFIHVVTQENKKVQTFKIVKN